MITEDKFGDIAHDLGKVLDSVNSSNEFGAGIDPVSVSILAQKLETIAVALDEFGYNNETIWG